MEQILGVTYDAGKYKSHEHWVESRIHTVEADALDQAEGDNQARTRYQRMFWEPVVEGQVRDSHASLYTCCQSSLHQEPVLPTALTKAREDAKRHGRSEESVKSDNVTHGLGGIANPSGTGTGRLTIKFVDVCTKFVDTKDRMRRMKESQRRAKIRSKNASKRRSVVE